MCGGHGTRATRSMLHLQQFCVDRPWASLMSLHYGTEMCTCGAHHELLEEGVGVALRQARLLQDGDRLRVGTETVAPVGAQRPLPHALDCVQGLCTMTQLTSLRYDVLQQLPVHIACLPHITLLSDQAVSWRAMTRLQRRRLLSWCCRQRATDAAALD